MTDALTALMERDNLSREEALLLLKDAIEAVLEETRLDGDPYECWTSATGLEPDYLISCLFDYGKMQ